MKMVDKRNTMFTVYFIIILALLKYVILEDIRDLNAQEFIALSTDIQKFRFGDVKKEDITFYKLSRTSQKEMFTDNSELDISKPFKFLIHGWIENNRRTWYQKLADELLINGDFNVIEVDYEHPARSAYISSAANSKLVGKIIADFILELKIPTKSLHIIAHSLGAHVAGYAAKQIKLQTGNRPFRISGLDPAGPYFRQFRFVSAERLDKTDADIVDVIHTDSGIYGINFPVGTLDILVNTGYRPQPGCLLNFEMSSFVEVVEYGMCSHTRSVNYFIEWINNGTFNCKMCKYWSTVLPADCIGELVLSEKDIDDNMEGICITNTSDHAPYLNEK